jgi:hypothetical protein
VTFHDGFRQSPPSACIYLPGRAYDFRTPQGPFIDSKKSTLESLGIDELMMLDNFYLSNVTAVFSSNALLILSAKWSVAP